MNNLTITGEVAQICEREQIDCLCIQRNVTAAADIASTLDSVSNNSLEEEQDEQCIAVCDRHEDKEMGRDNEQSDAGSDVYSDKEKQQNEETNDKEKQQNDETKQNDETNDKEKQQNEETNDKEKQQNDETKQNDETNDKEKQQNDETNDKEKQQNEDTEETNDTEDIIQRLDNATNALMEGLSELGKGGAPSSGKKTLGVNRVTRSRTRSMQDK